MKFYCCPSFEFTLRLPTSLPCEPPDKTLEEEFGLRKSRSKQDAASQCLQVSGTALLFVAVAIGAVVLCREYLGGFMSWMANLPGWQGPVLFAVLFIPISFPMMWGYIVLNLGAGYLYGLYVGVVITSLGAAVGSWVSFIICRVLWQDWVMTKLGAYENLKQIVKVIEGRQGFKIIMMTRLTPVPFGLQNALFSVRGGVFWFVCVYMEKSFVCVFILVCFCFCFLFCFVLVFFFCFCFCLFVFLFVSPCCCEFVAHHFHLISH